MKLFTNENNTSTLKILVAAEIAGTILDVEVVSFKDRSPDGPNLLPSLVLNEDLTFFSSNAALMHLMPRNDVSQSRCEELAFWEAVNLYPTVRAVITSKTVSRDLSQTLLAHIAHLENLLSSQKYLLSNTTCTAADISIWCSLYPIYFNNDYKRVYLTASSNVLRWFKEVEGLASVKKALKVWGGSVKKVFSGISRSGEPPVTMISGTQESSSDPVLQRLSKEEIELAKECWLKAHTQLPKEYKEEKIVLPMKNRKNILITSALPYVNNIPHLGNIIGCVLSADIFARYCRMCGYNTLFVCGTDEYGTATETKALEEGLTPRQICDKYFAIHNDVYRWFNIGFDFFGRTSTEEQTTITQKMFLKLNEKGFVTKSSVDQLYCVKCEKFLADRFVEGTCHHPGCLYDNARGDQCDKCGKLINAVELKDPRCKVCSNAPVMRVSEQFFLDLSSLQPSLKSWVSKNEAGWSQSARAITQSWLKEELHPRAITRDLKWGVPVPLEGYTNKVFYVWFDAPMGYLSITQSATGQFEKWWKPDKGVNVKLYQFMAKDNVPFHSVMFPATLLGINEGYQLVNHLYATEYLNYEDGKFSKSRGVGVFGTDAQDTGIPADVWRFYLASIRPESSDSAFSWAELGTRNNSELLNNLGNFCHRSLSFCFQVLEATLKPVELSPADIELIGRINRDVAAYVQNMSSGKLREALRNVLSITKHGNQYLQTEQPWVLLKGGYKDIEKGGSVITICCNVVALIAALLTPYMPQTGRQLAKQLNVNISKLRINPEKPTLIQYLAPGHKINKPEPLFAKIEPAMLEKLKQKYAGTQSDREAKSAESTRDNIAALEQAVATQGDTVRALKSTTNDKAIWQAEINKLVDLKRKLMAAQEAAMASTSSASNLQESVADLEKAVAKQAEAVRAFKASTKDKAVWQPEVNKLLELKAKLAAAQKLAQEPPTSGTVSLEVLEKAIAEQADKVRALKASTKDKKVWQPEVNKLLDLKAKFAGAQKLAHEPSTSAASAGASVEDLEKAVAEQAGKVRAIKASTKDKKLWQPEINKLLNLKTKLAGAQKLAQAVSTSAEVSLELEGDTNITTLAQESSTSAGESLQDLEKAVAEQADKVRALKASTKDKKLWQPEVNKLLDLKAKLASAQKFAQEPSTSAGLSVEPLEKAVAEQAEKVRAIKASTKDKNLWQPEVNRLLALKAKLAGAKKLAQEPSTSAGASLHDLEKAVAVQGLRALQASTKHQKVWQPEIDKLLDLQAKLVDAQNLEQEQEESLKKAVAEQAHEPSTSAASAGASVEDLEKAVAEQGEKLRALKASTKDKKVLQPEINKLLDLKIKLAEAQNEVVQPSTSAPTVAELEFAVSEQANKVRALKASTKDKSVWQPEVNKLLDLKKQLEAAKTRQ